MTSPTLRQRLNDYEFTDEQEMTLTLELLNRIEKDIDELKTQKTREGFSLYVTIAGIGTPLFILLSELNKLTTISFSRIGVIFFAAILISKIPWAFYRLITIDHASQKQQMPGRFFWTNEIFFENRPSNVFQSIVFLVSLPILFIVPMPLWVMVFTGISFLLYVFIIGLLFVLSFKKEAYVPTGAKKTAIVGLPLLFILFTIVSLIGLIFQMRLPVGEETRPYLVAALLLVTWFFADMLIRRSTPSLLLEKLQRLRYDIIFLQAKLQDAWIRYDVHVNGNDISEELREDMDEVIRSFNSLDLHQSQKRQFLSAINEELQKLEMSTSKLTDEEFRTVDDHKAKFFSHVDEMDRIFDYLNPKLTDLANQIHKISRATQEWQRADEYHQYILSRTAKIEDEGVQIAQEGKEADDRLRSLQLRKIEGGKP